MSVPPLTAIGSLLSATLADGGVVDIAIDAGRVVAVVPAGSPRPRTEGATLDLDGHLLVTAAADPHAHLDKALSWDEIDPPFGDLPLAVASWHAYSDRMTTAEILDRARRAAERLLTAGVTAVRSHVDLLPGPEPLRGVDALVALRAELDGILDLELVALGGWQTPDAVFDLALDAGVDLMGGAPHLAPEPLADLDRLLAVAARRGVGIDLHTDESLDGVDTLAAYARGVADRPVVKSAGHCVRLSELDADALADVIDEVRRADIGIIALPLTNLYLQGWGHGPSMPRGIAPLRALIDAGVRVAAGGDNIRDPFNPVGRADPFETAALLVAAAHLTPAEALTAVTDGARDVMALPVAGPRPGAVADLLAIRATGIGEAIAFAPVERTVIKAGRLVSRTTVDIRTALPPRLVPSRKVSAP